MDPAMSPIAAQFQAATAQWYAVLYGYALWTFNILAALEIVVTLIYRLGTNTLFWDIVLLRLFKICTYGIILVNSSWIIPSLLEGFIYAGSTAGGFTGDLNPQGVFMQGCFLAGKLLEKMGDVSLLFHPAANLTALFIAFGIILSYLVIAGQLLLTLIESFLVCSAGTLLLGFGGSSLTSEITTRYLSYIVGVGIKLFLLTLICGLGAALGDTWAQMIIGADLFDFYSLFNVLGGCVAFGLVAWKIPNLTSSLVVGSLGMGLSEAMNATHEAGRAVSTVAATAAAPAVGAAATGTAMKIGAATSQAHGGGLYGAMRGAGTAASALAREAASASVPRLSRGNGNLQKQHNDLKKNP